MMQSLPLPTARYANADFASTTTISTARSTRDREKILQLAESGREQNQYDVELYAVFSWIGWPDRHNL
jgi:hypothetical protein